MPIAVACHSRRSLRVEKLAWTECAPLLLFDRSVIDEDPRQYPPRKWSEDLRNEQVICQSSALDYTPATCFKRLLKLCALHVKPHLSTSSAATRALGIREALSIEKR